MVPKESFRVKRDNPTRCNLRIGRLRFAFPMSKRSRALDRLLPIPLDGRNRIWLTILQSIWIKPHRKVGFSFCNTLEESQALLTILQGEIKPTFCMWVLLITGSKVPRKAGVVTEEFRFNR